MKVLFVSGELIAGDLALRLKQEGCDIKLYIRDKDRADCFDNMIKKVDDWKKELGWVGKKGLIVFDDVGYGKVQDDLRKQGYLVIGGSTGGDKLERDREFGQNVFLDYGIKNVLGTLNFSTIKEAIGYIKKNHDYWVVKQNGHLGMFNYVGVMKDGSDATSILESYQKQGLEENITVSLQKKVEGVEIGVARYFNGNDWIGPIEFNIEHKKFLNNDLGPLTAEMGTVMWYNDDEKNKLYQETLAKIKPFLQKINFKGDVDINCIVDKNHCYPLELTTRFGSPAIHLQMEIHQTPWKDFLLAAAKGEKINLKYKKGYGVVVCVAIPPFPYVGMGISSKFYSKGTLILFKRKISNLEWKRIHLEEVSKKRPGNDEPLCVAGSNGYILYVTGFGKTVKKAQAEAYDLVEQIILPKMMYRTDIGKKFIDIEQKKLKQWGWI